MAEPMVYSYIGKLILYVGGINQIMGRLTRLDKDLYGIFVMIDNPCFFYQNEKGVSYAKMGGDAELFQPYILIYHPADKPMEIREINPGSQLEKDYFKEINRKKPKLIQIVTPGLP